MKNRTSNIEYLIDKFLNINSILVSLASALGTQVPNELLLFETRCLCLVTMIICLLFYMVLYNMNLQVRKSTANELSKLINEIKVMKNVPKSDINAIRDEKNNLRHAYIDVGDDNAKC